MKTHKPCVCVWEKWSRSSYFFAFIEWREKKQPKQKKGMLDRKRIWNMTNGFNNNKNARLCWMSASVVEWTQIFRLFVVWQSSWWGDCVVSLGWIRRKWSNDCLVKCYLATGTDIKTDLLQLHRHFGKRRWKNRTLDRIKREKAVFNAAQLRNLEEKGHFYSIFFFITFRSFLFS